LVLLGFIPKILLLKVSYKKVFSQRYISKKGLPKKEGINLFTGGVGLLEVLEFWGKRIWPFKKDFDWAFYG